MRIPTTNLEYSLQSIKAMPQNFNSTAVLFGKLLLKGFATVEIPMTSIDPLTYEQQYASKKLYVEYSKTTGTPFTENKNLYSTNQINHQEDWQHLLAGLTHDAYTMSYKEYVFKHTATFKQALDTNKVWNPTEMQAEILKELVESSWIERKRYNELVNALVKAGGPEYSAADGSGVVSIVEESAILDADAGTYPFDFNAIMSALKGGTRTPSYETVVDLTKLNDVNHGDPMKNYVRFTGERASTDSLGAAPVNLFLSDLGVAERKLEKAINSPDILTTVQTAKKGFRINTSSLKNFTPGDDMKPVMNVDSMYVNPYNTFESLTSNYNSTTGTGKPLVVIDTYTFERIKEDEEYASKALNDLSTYFGQILLNTQEDNLETIDYAVLNGNAFLILPAALHPFTKDFFIEGNGENNKSVRYSAVFSIYPDKNFFVVPQSGPTANADTFDAKDINPTLMLRDEMGAIVTYQSPLEIMTSTTQLPANQVGSSNYANPSIDIKIRFGYNITKPKSIKILAFESPL